MSLVQRQRLGIGNSELLVWDLQGSECDVLGDGKVFAVTPLSSKKFDGRGPIVFLVSMLLIGEKVVAIEEAINRAKFVFVASVQVFIHQILPVDDSAACTTTVFTSHHI